jgi:hypothetical protein
MVPVYGTFLLCAQLRMCDAMKLMGASMLSRLAAMAGADIPRGAVAALHAELEAATWDACYDVLDQYPTAMINGDVITIPMGEGHCVCFVANYQSGMIVIEYAGRARSRGEATTGRKPS